MGVMLWIMDSYSFSFFSASAICLSEIFAMPARPYNWEKSRTRT